MTKQDTALPAASAEDTRASIDGAWPLIAAFTQLIGLNIDAASLRQHFASEPHPLTLRQAMQAMQAMQALGLEGVYRRGSIKRLAASATPVLACA